MHYYVDRQLLWGIYHLNKNKRQKFSDDWSKKYGIDDSKHVTVDLERYLKDLWILYYNYGYLYKKKGKIKQEDAIKNIKDAISTTKEVVKYGEKKYEKELKPDDLKRIASFTMNFDLKLTMTEIRKYHTKENKSIMVGDKNEFNFFDCTKFLYPFPIGMLIKMLDAWEPGFQAEVMIKMMAIPGMDSDATKPPKRAAEIFGEFCFRRNKWDQGWRMFKGWDRRTAIGFLGLMAPPHRANLLGKGAPTETELVRLLWEMEKLEREKKPVDPATPAPAFSAELSEAVKGILYTFSLDKSQKLRYMLVAEAHRENAALSGRRILPWDADLTSISYDLSEEKKK